jgi:hypothetical protein
MPQRSRNTPLEGVSNQARGREERPMTRPGLGTAMACATPAGTIAVRELTKFTVYSNVLHAQ